MASNESLPPGWESRRDTKTGKTYYLNHYLKTTTWNDPRKSKGIQQSKHPSPKINEHIPLQDLSNVNIGRINNSKDQPRSQESVFIASETDEAIAKISSMFPTVSDTHIKLLMKNCRYMKSIFPEADETVILDVLYNNDNNIQKTTEHLKGLGYENKKSVKNNHNTVQTTNLKKIDDVKVDVPPVEPIPTVKSFEEKMEIKNNLKLKHEAVPDQLIDIALESVNYDLDKASNLLKSMIEDTVKTETTKVISVSAEQENKSAVETVPTGIPISQSRQSLKYLLKTDKSDKEKSGFHRINENLTYKSKYFVNTNGANPDLAKGTNENLLLEDYIKWQGPDSSIRKGPQKNLAVGPNPLIRNGRSCKPRGPNLDLRKMSNCGLAKSRMFSQMRTLTVGGEPQRQ